MAKRNNVFKVESDAVQGEGSYVVFRAIQWGEAKALRRELDALTDDDKMARNDRLLSEHIVAWNWVDDDDQPLLLPKDDPAVIDALTQQEITWLGEALTGTADKKN